MHRARVARVSGVLRYRRVCNRDSSLPRRVFIRRCAHHRRRSLRDCGSTDQRCSLAISRRYVYAGLVGVCQYSCRRLCELDRSHRGAIGDCGNFSAYDCGNFIFVPTRISISFTPDTCVRMGCGFVDLGLIIWARTQGDS